MKKMLIAATALVAAFTGSVASAQSYYGHDRRDGYHQNYDRRDQRWDDRRDHRDRYDRHDRREYRRWSRGDRLPSHYRSRSYYVDDYRRYGYGAPPRGHRYYRTDTGDVVLAAIATCVIISILSH